eukprot:6188494-Pleurochrysis_carterae.AAC.1
MVRMLILVNVGIQDLNLIEGRPMYDDAKYIRIHGFVRVLDSANVHLHRGSIREAVKRCKILDGGAGAWLRRRSA